MKTAAALHHFSGIAIPLGDYEYMCVRNGHTHKHTATHITSTLVRPGRLMSLKRSASTIAGGNSGGNSVGGAGAGNGASSSKMRISVDVQGSVASALSSSSNKVLNTLPTNGTNNNNAAILALGSEGSVVGGGGGGGNNSVASASAGPFSVKSQKQTGATSTAGSSRGSSPSRFSPTSGKRKKGRRKKKFGDSDILTEISQEDELRAMLGYKSTTSGAMQPYLYREDFCACCGTRHLAPHLLNMYAACISCNNCLREPIKLRMLYEQTLQDAPLEILFATYGDEFDCTKAVEVTEKCKEKVIELKGRFDRIAFKAHSNMQEYFGVDPSPGKPKQLRIRYRMHNIFGTLVFSVQADNTFPDWVLLQRPAQRNLRIIRANYGHPKGLTAQGRMSFDVQELIQGLVDVGGGSYLNITSMQPISPIFGDPCPGYPKDMRIEFEVMSTFGEDTFDVVRGHLRRRIHIEATPIIAPIILISKFQIVTSAIV
jgi:hypothetical protein